MTFEPTVGVGLFTVLATAMSALRVTVSVSVALLLAVLGSPLAAVTVAVFGMDPLALGATEHEAVYVAEPPAGRLTLSLMLPDPAAVHVPPPAPGQVQLQVRLAGNVSATVAPVALLGPAFDAVIVYVTEPPAAALVTPS